MASFIQEYHLLFMLLILSVTIFIYLRTIVGILVQVAFAAIIILVHQADLSWLVNIMGIIQIILTLAVFYWLKVVIDRNYRIILEKTHLTGHHLTDHNYTGIEKKGFFSYK